VRPVSQSAPAGRAGPGFPKVGWIGLSLLGTFVLLGAAGPVLARFPPRALSGGSVEPPSFEHLVGTNQLGQDLASQLLFGARSSLLVASITAVGTLLLGALVGVPAGWLGGKTDFVLMRAVDVVLAVPRLPLLIILGAYLGRDLVTIALVMSVVFWPPTARILRTEVRSLRQRLHLKAAQSFGGGAGHALRRHVLPELRLVIVATLVIAASRVVLFEAGLAFLGLGDPSRTSWGSTMRDAQMSRGLFYTRIWTWWMLPPAVAVTLVLLGFTFVGMALEDGVNPRLARHRPRRSPARLAVSTTAAQ